MQGMINILVRPGYEMVAQLSGRVENAQVK